MLERLFGGTSARAPDRRQANRSTASDLATVKAVSGEHLQARLLDVSTHGCSLSASSEWLRNGRIVTLTLAPDESLQAIIRWSSDNATGFEFLRPVTSEKRQWMALIDSPWGA